MRIRLLATFFILLSALLGLNNPAFAADAPPAILIIHNGQFEPEKLILPSRVKMKLTIRNQDAIPLEFESYDLSREVVIPAHNEVSIYIGPLDPGIYKYFNDLNHAMTGSIEVREAAAKGN